MTTEAAINKEETGWVEGRVGGRVDGWIDGWMDGSGGRGVTGDAERREGGRASRHV